MRKNKENFTKSSTSLKMKKKRIEISTRGQADSKVWVNAREGRITASVHHEVFTKVNSIARKRVSPLSKVTPLIAKLIYRDKALKQSSGEKSKNKMHRNCFILLKLANIRILNFKAVC